MNKLHLLKIGSIVVGIAGYFISNELQRRETEDVVREILDEREKQANQAAHKKH